jgi:hypothetical protein
MTSVRFHPDQNRRSITQKTLSGAVSLGREFRAFKTQVVVAKPEFPAVIPGGNTNCSYQADEQSQHTEHTWVVSEKHMPPDFSPDSILASHSSRDHSTTSLTKGDDIGTIS